MKFSDLSQVQERVSRIVGRLQEKSGIGFSQSHTFPNGETHHYKIRGGKSLEEFEDDLLTAFIWVWNMKDYLKEIAKKNGKEPQHIEKIVNSSSELQLVADVANRAKHGELKKSRSSHFASISEASMTLPQEAIAKITFGAFDVSTEVQSPEKIEFKATILAKSGTKLGEADYILSTALGVWEEKGVPYATGA